MGSLFSRPKAPAPTPPPPVEDTSKQTEQKLEKARTARVRALKEAQSYEGQFSRKTGLKL